MEYFEVARARTPRGEIVLRERRPEDAGGPAVLELRVNGVFVMDTAETGTERALARMALDLVASPRDVLIGGLGLGFTAHEVLGDARVERVVVAEIEDPIVQWLRKGTIPHGPTYLADSRLTVLTLDLADAVAEAGPGSYDLVLLDVDNGPGYLVHAHNAAVYEAPFLRAVRETLRPGGALAVWSADPAPSLERDLETVFGAVAVRPLDVRLQERAEQYWLYLARG
jgi:spermidine synthase